VITVPPKIVKKSSDVRPYKPRDAAVHWCFGVCAKDDSQCSVHNHRALFGVGLTMAALVSFFKFLLLAAKILAGFAYILGAIYMLCLLCLYADVEALAIAIYLSGLAFIAFYFARKPGRPFENGPVAILVGLHVSSALAISAFEMIVNGIYVQEVAELASFLGTVFYLLLPTVVQLRQVKVIRSRELCAIKLDFLVLRSFASDVIETRAWTWIDTVRFRLTSVGSGNSEPPIPEILSRFVFAGKVSSRLR
jgi:hypothetical protein